MPSIQAQNDYWQPVIVPARGLASAAAEEQGDFWSLDLLDVGVESPVTGDDWGSGAALPWFDPDLSENLYLLDTDAPSLETVADRRGRWLVQLLDIPEQRRRTTYGVFFAELFEAFPEQQTFRALSELAVSGASPDSLRSGCSFRMTFLDSPKLATRRFARGGATYVYHEPEAMLSWRRAVRIAESCWGRDPEEVIDDDWFASWLQLRSGHALYWSYLDFIEWKLKIANLGYYEDNAANVGDGQPRKNEYARLIPDAARLYRGQTDIVGVLVEQPPIAKFIARRVS